MSILADEIELRTQAVLHHGFHQYCGIKLVKQEPGKAVITFPVDQNTGNPGGFLHGGILYAVMDVCAYLALIPLFEPGENAVSHDVHVSVMRPAVVGDVIELRSEVRRRGKGIAFIQVEAWNRDQLLGTGTVTKTFLRGR